MNHRDRLFFRLAFTISALLFLLVLLLNRRVFPGPQNIPEWAYRLPALNALINACCAVLLCISYLAIRRKKIALHKTLNITTFCLSALFLLSYVTFHYFVPETTFGGEGVIRTVYYTILITHIILAAGVLPLVLLSFYHGLQGNVAKHRVLVRFSFPIWLYVTVSGVLVYLMISPYYPF